jgi:parallel beta-helix repeat protein
LTKAVLKTKSRNRQLPLFVIFLVSLSITCAFSFRPCESQPTQIIVPDQYPTIQEAINAANTGDTIFVKSGLYYEHIIANKTVQLIGEGPSTTVIDGNLTGTVVRVTSDNVNITGFTIQRSGNAQVPYLDAGICLNGTRGCTISDNRAIDNGFAAISLLYSQQNTITHNNMSSAGWGGIHLMSSSRNVVSANIIDSKYGGINGHVSSNYNNITENVISNCTYGMFWHAANYNNFRRNNISAIAIEGIWLQDQVSYNVVSENNLINNAVAIRLQGPNYYNTLSRNIITGAEYGIKIENNARYTRIVDNIIVDNRAGNDSWSAGIRLDIGTGSEIHSNIISGNKYGVLLYSYSPNVSVCGNNITDNEFGLRVASGGSHYLNMSDNIVMNNRGYGLGLTGFTSGSNYASITRNIIANNSDGIALGQYSNYNTISQNNISKNRCGFYIEYSTQNTIWGNNFVDNDQQVNVSASSVNSWDGGYDAGGNYWSNYTGVDMYRGQNQNIPGSDGVGDTPHTINSNNRDNSPLMTPWFWTPNDVAVETVTLSKTIVGQGYNMYANVTVANQGIYAESFNVTLYSNATATETIEVTLMSGDSATLTFTWNTASFVYGNYTIWVYAEQVPGEAYAADNTYVAGVVTITIPGDVDGDFFVNIQDVGLVAANWQKIVPPADPNADINGDGIINITDAAIIGLNWQKQA